MTSPARPDLKVLVGGLTPARGLRVPPGTSLVYARSSSRAEATNQSHSIPQQHNEIYRKWGEVPLTIPGTEIPTHYGDKMSGRKWDRPQFERMVAFCLANPQPRENKCHIRINHPSRFARPVRKGKNDELIVEARKAALVYLQLWEAGWLPRFVNGVADTGFDEVDDFTFQMAIRQAGETSANLTLDTSRGKQDWAKLGYWVYSRAPFGTVRFCTRRKVPLRDSTGEKYTDDFGEVKTLPGDYGQKNSTILQPHDEKIAFWTDTLAPAFLRHWSFPRLVELMNKSGYRNSHNNELWDTRGVRAVLTNKVLIGKVPYGGRKVQEKEWYDANWEPMVPLSLWQKVQDEMERRDQQRRKRPEPYSARVLSNIMFCADCGCLYTARTRKPNGKEGHFLQYGSAEYKHRSRTYNREKQEMRERQKALGCREYHVDGWSVECAVRDELKKFRTGPAWGLAMKALYEEAVNNVEASENSVEKAKAKVKAILESARAKADEIDRTPDEFSKQMHRDGLARLGVELQAAQEAVKDAESASMRSTDDWQMIEEILDETSEVLEAWEHSPLEDKLRIIGYWVRRIDIQFDPKDRSHGRPYQLHIWLRHFPNTPHSVVCRNMTREEKKQFALDQRALQLGVRATEVCPSCFESPCVCGTGKPLAVQAMTVGSTRRGISKVTVALRNLSRVEVAKLRGVYKEPQAPHHERRREDATDYMRKWRQKKRDGKTVMSPARAEGARRAWEARRQKQGRSESE
jgi:hypothetical protein